MASDTPAVATRSSNPARASPRKEDSSSMLPTHSMRGSSLRTRCPLKSRVSPLSPRWILRLGTVGFGQLLVEHDQLADGAAPVGLGIDESPGRHFLNLKILVELANKRCVAVRQHEEAASLVERTVDAG